MRTPVSAFGLALGLIVTIGLLAWTFVRAARPPGAAPGLVPDEPAGDPTLAAGPGLERGRIPATRGPLRAPAERAPADGDSAASSASSSHLAIGVRVLDSTGVPVHGATFELPLELGGAELPSDEMGYARFRGAVMDAGDGLATVFAPGLARVRVATSWEPGRDTWLGDVLLARAGALRGVVVDEHRAPVAGVDVFVLEPDRDQWGDPRSHFERGEGRQARTDASGSFFLEDLAEGTHQAYARAPDRPWTRSAPFLVSPGNETSGVRIELAPAAPRSYVRGVLLDAAGVPTNAASILYDPVDTRTHGNRRVRPRSDGRFVLALARPAPHRIEVEPDDWEASVVRVPVVQPGARDVVLRLEPPRWLWVRVRDEAGASLTGGRVEALFADRDERQPRAISDLWPDGRARLHRPLEDFRLRTTVAGHAPLTTGLYRLGGPEPIELTLHEVPAVRGVVRRAGSPVAGAELELHTLSAVDSARRKSTVARSDSRGMFILPIHPRLPREPTRVSVFVSSPEGVHVFSEPFVLEPELGARGIELELGVGGAIAGRLLVPAGERAGGWSVFAVAPFGIRRSARASDDGDFLLEHLAPGRWTLGATDAARRSQVAADPAHADVIAGRTVRCDVPLPDLDGAVVTGRLEIEGHSLSSGWSVTLRPKRSAPAREAVLDADGAFQVALEASGLVELTFRSIDPRWRHLVVTQRVPLERGENRHVCRFAVGEVFGTYSVPGAEGFPFERLVLSSASGEVSYKAVLETDGGALAPTQVPAGEAYLRAVSAELAAALVDAADTGGSIELPKVLVPRGGRLDLGTVVDDD